VRIPAAPKPYYELLDDYDTKRLVEILNAKIGTSPNGKYRHWDILRRLTPPAGFTVQDWWMGIKFARHSQYRELPLKDRHGKPFVYMIPDEVFAALHRLDSAARGRIALADPVTNPDTRDRFIVSSLLEEAITSSQLEGASTTRQVAAEMIRAGRPPRDTSEKMIFNNYHAMQWIRPMRSSPLSVEMLLELHRVLTEETLDDPQAAGRLQRPGEERVDVVDNSTGDVLHRPPPAEELPERVHALVEFANSPEQAGQPYLHPIIRAIVLHFWLAYDHPFVDGNGRTARALFYWSMLRHDYWLFEYVSISSILKAAPARYGRAFLFTETDGDDLTYFIIHQLQVMERAIAQLERYLQEKMEQVKRVEQMLRTKSRLNHRQLALLSHAIRHPGQVYTVKSHRTSHNIANGTARSDLFELADHGLLDKRRIGSKTLEFRAPDGLEERIRRFA
jgi:Fic family protein